MQRGAQVLGLAAIAAAGLVAGCGSSGPSAQSTLGSADQRAEQALVRLARCVRTHGLPGFPGPVVGSDGVPKFPDSAPRVPASTRTACASVANQIPAGYTETRPASNADLQKLIAFAHCMRQRIPAWPDPNALGEFPIDSQIQQGGKKLFVPVAHACARLNPDPSGGIHVVRAQP